MGTRKGGHSLRSLDFVLRLELGTGDMETI